MTKLLARLLARIHAWRIRHDLRYAAHHVAERARLLMEESKRRREGRRGPD